MADIVNLRQARKRKAREERQQTADQNRVAHGRPKSDRALASAKHALMEKRLDGHRLNDGLATED